MANKNSGHYLNDDTEKSREMARRVLQFLKSDESSNQMLAFNFIKAGGINPLFFYELLLLYLWNKDTKIRKVAEQTLKLHLSDELFAHLKATKRNFHKNIQEGQMTEYLEELRHPELDFGRLLMAFQEETGKCRQACLQYDESFEYIVHQEKKNAVLSLRNSKLASLSPNIGNFQDLKVLYLYRNQLKVLPNEFADLQQLYILSLAKNKFKEFPNVLLENKKLRVLDLSENQISELPDDIGKLQNLERLDLSHNRLKIIPETIYDLNNLRFLNLQKTSLVKNEKQVQYLKEILPNCRIITNEDN